MPDRERSVDGRHVIVKPRQFVLAQRVENADLQIERRLDPVSHALKTKDLASPGLDGKPVPFAGRRELSADFAGTWNLLRRGGGMVVDRVKQYRRVGHADHDRNVAPGVVVGKPIQQGLGRLERHRKRRRLLRE